MGDGMPVIEHCYECALRLRAIDEAGVREAALREALRFYAHEDTWSLPDDPKTSMTPADEDRGERARGALRYAG
jgi:hypothetical protein